MVVLLLDRQMEFSNCRMEFSSYRMEFSNYQMEFSNCQVEFSNCQMEFSNCRMEFSNCQMEFSNCRMEFSNYRMEFSNFLFFPLKTSELECIGNCYWSNLVTAEVILCWTNCKIGNKQHQPTRKKTFTPKSIRNKMNSYEISNSVHVTEQLCQAQREVVRGE
jgi:hypothetical protein